MKILPVVGLATLFLPTIANAYYDYEPVNRDNYVGIRIHKNDNIAFRFETSSENGTTIRDDSFGIGAYVGNRLTSHIKIEFETLYNSGREKKYNNDFSFNVWSNMLNLYVYQQIESAVEPYFGFGIGVSGLWGDVSGDINLSDSTADMSWSAMLGVNFALNSRIDLNLGLKYQNYGDIKMAKTTTEIDATEIYIGAAYKFGL